MTVTFCFPSGLRDSLSLLCSSPNTAVFSSTAASSDEAPPPVPLPRRRLLLGSFSSTTVTSRPGSFRRTLADGESSTRPRNTSPSADCRLRGDRELVEGGDMAPWSLLSSSFALCSTGQLDSMADSDTLLSLSPSFSSLPDLEFLPSGSPAHCCFPPGGEVEGREGTGLLWERFDKVLVLEAW